MAEAEKAESGLRVSCDCGRVLSIKKESDKIVVVIESEPAPEVDPPPATVPDPIDEMLAD